MFRKGDWRLDLMTISTYHVHNVLKAYGRQLSRKKRLRRTKGVARVGSPGRAILSTKARQEAVIDRLTSHIVNGLIKKGLSERTGKKGVKDSESLKDRLQPAGRLMNRRDAIVSISEASREVQRAKEVIMSEPDIRLEKVRAIREEIEAGTYEIYYDKIAEYMLRFFMNEIVA